jgi:predicted extracellular nuclease
VDLAFSNAPGNGQIQQIDILALREVCNPATTTQEVVNLLNSVDGPGTYSRGSLNGTVPPTGDGTQGVVYRTSTVQLLGEAAITTPG